MRNEFDYQYHDIDDNEDLSKLSGSEKLFALIILLCLSPCIIWFWYVLFQFHAG